MAGSLCVMILTVIYCLPNWSKLLGLINKAGFVGRHHITHSAHAPLVSRYATSTQNKNIV